jgi:hypothetical protein
MAAAAYDPLRRRSRTQDVKLIAFSGDDPGHTWRAASMRTMLASLIFFVSELPAERARRIEEAKALRERYGGVTERRSQSAHEAIIVARRTVAIMGARRGALGHFVLPQQSGL